MADAVRSLSNRIRNLEVAPRVVSSTSWQFKLTEDVTASSTTVVVNGTQLGFIVEGGWLIIDPWTTECEIRKITSISGNTLTIAALDYAHAMDDAVLFTVEPVANVKWFGALGNGTTNDTTSVQRAIDQIKADTLGWTVYFPQGQYLVTQITLPRDDSYLAGGIREVSLVGDGKNSRIISNTASPAVVWEATTHWALAGFYNLMIENTVAGGSCIKWLSDNTDHDRLGLTIKDCWFKYRSALAAHGDTYCLDFHGLLFSDISNIRMMGGSPVGGGFIGWGMRLSSCSESQISGYYGYANCGRGIYILNGGDIEISQVRMDSGTRTGPTHQLENCGSINWNGMRSEGLDDNPFLYLKNCINSQFYGIYCPISDSDTDATLIKLENSSKNLFFGGRVGDQYGLGGGGVAISIDYSSQFNRWYGLTLTGSTIENNIYLGNNNNYIEGIYEEDSYTVSQRTQFAFGMRNNDEQQVNGGTWTNVFTRSLLWNPGDLADGAVATQTVDTFGTAITDTAIASLSTINAAGWLISANMISATQCQVTIMNKTGGNSNLAEGTLRIVVSRYAVNDLLRLLYDEFTTNDPAPIVTPRTCEPGPGSLVVSDAGNNVSITTNKLASSGGSPYVASANAYQRLNGMASKSDLELTSGDLFYGWNATQGSAFVEGWWLHDSGTDTVLYSREGGLNVQLEDFPTAEATYVTSLREIGHFLIVKISGTWRLLWVSKTGYDMSMYENLVGSTGVWTQNNRLIRQLPAPFNSEYGLASARKATAVASEELEGGKADCIVEATWVAVTGETFELSVRRSDDNNRWILRCSQGGSTIKLIERNASVETERTTEAQTFTNGTAYRIIARCNGDIIRVYVDTTYKDVYSSATFNNTATGCKVSHAVTNFITWPRDLTALSEILDQ